MKSVYHAILRSHMTTCRIRDIAEVAESLCTHRTIFEADFDEICSFRENCSRVVKIINKLSTHVYITGRIFERPFIWCHDDRVPHARSGLMLEMSPTPHIRIKSFDAIAHEINNMRMEYITNVPIFNSTTEYVPILYYNHAHISTSMPPPDMFMREEYDIS